MNLIANLFHEYGKRYEGEEVDLLERHRVSEMTAYDSIPVIYYDIMLHDSDIKIGECDLRLKMDERMFYYGHIGYHINKKFRGHHYASKACKVLFEIARDEFEMSELIITCDPDNYASYRTLSSMGGDLIATLDVPENHELYRMGEKQKCIFRFDLWKNLII